MAKLHTPLCDRLGIRLPIVQAPMPGTSTPALVAAVSQAGALGSFGSAYSQPEAMQRDAEAARAHTHLPFNMNLFVSKQPGAVEATAQRGALEAVAGYYQALGLPPPDPVRAPYAPDLEAQLRAIEEIRPAVFTFHLGDLPPERVRRLQSLGVKVGGSANCVAEARHLEAAGVDFIIAQGAEEDATLVTEKFSGKPARAITNRFLREMHERAAPQLPFPAQNALTVPLRAAAAKADNPDFVAMYAGQAAPLSRELPAAALVAALETETLEALSRLAALRG